MTDLAQRLAAVQEKLSLSSRKMASNTERNYRSQLGLFRRWLSENGVRWPEWDYRHLVLYLGEAPEGMDPMTRWGAINAIRRLHPERDDETRHPAVAKARKALQARKRTKGIRRAYPLTLAEVERLILAYWEPDPHRYESLYQWRKRCLRFEACCLLAFFGLLRVSELAALRWRDLEEQPDGSGRLIIRRSKTDQEGIGQERTIPAPVLARVLRYRSHLLRGEWSPDGTEITYVPMSRGPYATFQDRKIALEGESFRKAIQRAAPGAGLEGKEVLTHSFRRGAATAMADAGVTDRQIAKAGRWSSPDMVNTYADAGRLREDGMAVVLREHEKANGGGE